jgi:biotin transport system substrate-specific component
MKLELFIEKKTKMSGVLNHYGVGTLQIVLGSLFLGLMAQIAFPLPFTPVPLSMQTFGVSLLAISLGSRKAFLAVLAYLLQATLGLPVLAKGLSNPLWMMGPNVGYLMGFLVSSFIVGKLMESFKSQNFFKNWLILSLNEVTILFFGAAFLGFFLDGEKVFAMGVLPFIPGALLKITMAASTLKPISWIKAKL